jgi:hypothetical protein
MIFLSLFLLTLTLLISFYTFIFFSLLCFNSYLMYSWLSHETLRRGLKRRREKKNGLESLCVELCTAFIEQNCFVCLFGFFFFLEIKRSSEHNISLDYRNGLSKLVLQLCVSNGL